MNKILSLFVICLCQLALFPQAAWAADIGTPAKRANAMDIVDAEVDFSDYTEISQWNFPYSWGGSESARARLSIVNGCLHFESAEATDPSWDCQFFSIGGVNAVVGVTYTLHFKIKGDHNGTVSLIGFGQTPWGQFPITTDWVEGTIDYVAAENDGNLLMQCGGWVGSWDIAYMKITHKEERFNLNVGVSPANSGSLNRSSGEFDLGTSIYMNASAKTDYQFVNWTENGSEVSTNRSFYYTMPAYDVELIANFVFKPGNPGDPDAPEQSETHRLKLNTKPANAGSFNQNSGGKFVVGESVYLRAYNNTDFVFSHWTEDGKQISNSSSFNYTMPDHDATLTAVYNYLPGNPADPDTAQVYYTLSLDTKPANAGYFSWDNNTQRVAGSSGYIYAYNNTDYVFREWQQDGKVVGRNYRYDFTMPAKNMKLVAVYDFAPSNPGNPGKNYWNAETGEVIVDDFTPGNLSNEVYYTTNGNYDAVQMMTIAGPINQYDWGVVNNYKNCTLLDLSRTYGMTYVPSYNFSGNNVLSSVVLPAGIETIDYYAFRNCSSLSSISILAATPPTIGYRAFEGIADSIVYVPADAISLYQEADGWKDFTILPLAKEVSSLEVNLPEGTDANVYKDMFIELVNAKSGQKLRYVITNRLTYTFNSLVHRTSYNVYLRNRQGNVLGQLDGIDIVDKDVSVTFSSLMVPRDLTLQVLTPSGDEVTAQTTITWMDEKGTYLAKGNVLTSQLEGNKVKFRITLPQSLGMQYLLPADSLYEVLAENSICITLKAIPQTTIAGKVTDIKTGQPLNGTTVAVSQMLNGLYSKSFTTKTDNKGQWSLQVFEAKTDITASMDDYVSKTQSFETLVAEVPDFQLKDINGTTIAINLTYQPTGGELQEYYSDYANVAYTVYNETAGKNVTELNVQYPQIVLMEQLPAGTVLCVTATSKNQKFVPVTATATVDDLDRASVTLPIVQLGGITATFKQTDNPAVVGILYDGNGRLLKKYEYASATLNINELQDGQYTLVTMASTQLLGSVGSLSQFAEAGLCEGVDYVKNSVTVRSGEMATIINALIPYFDETKLYYTSEGTTISVNKTEVTTGNYLTITGHLDFKSEYADQVSDVRLIVDLPEECTFVDNSVMRGSQTATYTFSDNQVVIPLDYYGERVRFCFIPTIGGEFNATASIQLSLAGKTIIQPIGKATFTVKDLSITVPASVASTTIPVSGTANGKATIKIYDGDRLIGQTNSLANGIWSTTCELFEPENLSSHPIYATVTNQQGIELQTETITCIYDESAVVVNKVTMINTAHTAANLDLYNYVTVFDFQNPSTSIPAYWYWPSYPDFTFLIDISYHDRKLIPYVWLHVFTSDGKTRSLRADYDEKRDSWVATDKFWSDALPTKVSVTIENMVFDLSNKASYEILMDQYNVGADDINLKETVEEEDGSSTSTYTDGNGEDVVSVTSYESDLSEEKLIEKLKEEGFEEDDFLNDDSDYKPENEDDILEEGEMKVLTDSTTGSMALIQCGDNKPKVAIIRVIREEGKQKSPEKVYKTILSTWKGFFRTYFDPVTCTQVTEYKNCTRYLDKYVSFITSTLVSTLVFVDYRLLPPGTKIPHKKVIAKLKRIRQRSEQRTECAMEYSYVPKNCPPPPPPPPPVPPTPPVPSVMDPSGYVYEGVASNRLQGVTATAYYKETVEDMYGDLHENVVLWNAEEYAQENPLFTDEYGMYQWDVPQGLWQVKFEKEGYQTTYSEWLPVPPPQLDVNIAMTQLRQPTVLKASAYDEGVEMEFDKFMDPETLNGDNIKVTKNGNVIEGTIELLNEEVAYEGQTQTYASKVRFNVPEGEELLSTDEVQLTVSRKVKSYAGVPMEEDYTQSFTVEPKVCTIAVDSLINVAYGGTRTLSVAALPVDASKGKKMIVKSLSQMIATVSADEVTPEENGNIVLTLDENGQAEIVVSGELPGSTVMSFAVEETDVEGQMKVNVKDATKLMAIAPRASRVSGTQVYRGTVIRLTSETEGAEIYYTLDGTCPCNTETAIKYNPEQPIVIADDNVTIKAMAQGHDLAESDVAEFSYSLKKSKLGYQLPEGWSWISHNLESNVPVNQFQENAERILSQTSEVISDPVFGFIGNLTELLPTKAYKMKYKSQNEMNLQGYEFDATQNSVPVEAGWNWIGYPMNQSMTVAEALNFYDASEGDFIVGQDGYAEFTDGEWKGSLEGMRPGQGYLYKSAVNNEIHFNTTIVSVAASRMGMRNYLISSPWAPAKHVYPNVMPLTALLYDKGSCVDPNDYVVGAFSGSECRGVGIWNDNRLLMNIYGQNGEDIHFVAKQLSTDLYYDLTEQLTFTADNTGTWNAPYLLTTGSQTTEITKVNDGMTVTPAVAKSYITVTAGGKDITYLTLTNMGGQTVISLSDLGKGATVTLGQLPEGMYIVTVNAGGQSYYKKILKANK